MKAWMHNAVVDEDTDLVCHVKADVVAVVEVAMFGYIVVKTDAPELKAGIFRPPSTDPVGSRPVTIRDDGVLQIEMLPNRSGEDRLVVHIDPRPAPVRMASVPNGETW